VKTIHEQGLARAFSAALAQGDVPMGAIQHRLDELCSDEPDDLSRFCVQKHHGQSYTAVDAYGVWLVDAWATAGLLAFGSIFLGAGPLPDRCVESNQLLLDGLPPPFTASFVPALHSGDCDDGHLRWSTAVDLRTRRGGRPGNAQREPPGAAPLEVGATSVSRTIMHLRKEQRLARWPYESTNLLVGVLTEAGRRHLGVCGEANSLLGLTGAGGVR